MPEYAMSPLKFGSGLPLAVVYDRTSVANDGTVASVQYWNHDTEAWEAAPRVTAKHVRPLERMAESGGDSNSWILAVALKPVSHLDCTVGVYRIDSTGEPTVPHEFISNTQALRGTGLD